MVRSNPPDPFEVCNDGAATLTASVNDRLYDYMQPKYPEEESLTRVWEGTEGRITQMDGNDAIMSELIEVATTEHADRLVQRRRW